MFGQRIAIGIATFAVLVGCNNREGEVAAVANPAPTREEVATSQPARSVPLDEVGACSFHTKSTDRLACFDTLSERHGLRAAAESPTSKGAGEWLTDTRTDPLTDKPIHTAFLIAASGKGVYGDDVTLIVRCKNNATEAYINWKSFLGLDSIRVTSRLDKDKATATSWELSTDNKASFMPGAISVLKRFEGAEQYVASVTPYNERPITAIFDLNGAAEALSDIRKECNW